MSPRNSEDRLKGQALAADALSPDTIALENAKDAHGATQYPVYLSAAFAADSSEDLEKIFLGQKFGYVYGRIQNPTVRNLEQKITRIASASDSRVRGSVVTATGMAALSGALMTLLSAGDTLISHESIFGGTISLFTRLLSKFGIRIHFVNFHDSEALNAAIREAERPGLLFCELMGNPSLDLQDIGAIGAIAERYNVPFLLDSTLVPPGFLNTEDAGIALELHSTTKFMCGNGTVLGGLLIDRGSYDWSACRDSLVAEFAQRYGRDNAFLAAFRFQALTNLGLTQQPFAASLTAMNIETMRLRVERCFQNAQKLASALETAISERNLAQLGIGVQYPGLEVSPYYARARRYLPYGAGALFALDLGSRERAFAFARSLKLARHMTNLGDLRTLVVHPQSTIFRDSSREQIRRAGVTEGMLRVSLGIEDIKDLTKDFLNALASV